MLSAVLRNAAPEPGKLSCIFLQHVYIATPYHCSDVLKDDVLYYLQVGGCVNIFRVGSHGLWLKQRIEFRVQHFGSGLRVTQVVSRERVVASGLGG